MEGQQNIHSQLYSIEFISQRRAQKKEELRQSKALIQRLTQELFTPQQSKNKIDNLMHHVNAGMAAYDGVMTGIKILRRVRNFFNRKKHN